MIISGIMTGLSWLCYFKALQTGETARGVTVDKFSLVFVLFFSAIFLKETMNFKMIFGCILITVGTIMMVI